MKPSACYMSKMSKYHTKVFLFHIYVIDFFDKVHWNIFSSHNIMHNDIKNNKYQHILVNFKKTHGLNVFWFLYVLYYTMSDGSVINATIHRLGQLLPFVHILSTYKLHYIHTLLPYTG